MATIEGVSFRDYEDGDLEWVLDAMVEGARATLNPRRAVEVTDESLRKSAKDDFSRFHDAAKKPEKITLAIDGNGRRVGLVWITMNMPFRDEGDNAWLLEVYVIPELRRHGLGRELLALAESWAKEHHVKEIWLNVGVGNKKALPLYESLGFELETMHLFKKLG